LSPRGELPIALNVESANGLTSEDVAERIAQWVEYVASNYERPLLYVSPHFWDTLPKRGIEANTDLCVSEWDVSEPAAISGWNSWSFWQYSSSTEVPGIRASVHLARFNGTVDELHRYLTRRNAPALVRSLDLSTITGIQQALNQLGCRPALVVDGVAGNKTRAAIESFQHATNLDVDGCAGEATQRALQQALSELNPNE
jgi:lysozyme